MPIDRKMAKMAFDSIMEGNLDQLKSHPLWDIKSEKYNKKNFSKLQQYGNNFMLLSAVDYGYMDIVKFLVEEVKVNVNQMTNGGETALHRAAYRKRFEFLMYLIKNGADIEANN